MTQAIVRVNELGHESSGAMTGFQGSAGDVGQLAVHAGTASAVAREEAEIKAAIVLARSAPRNEMGAYQKILKACQRPSFADGAAYSFPRGGSTVVGPSVYLAREMARCWGNVRSGIRVVSMDREYVHVKGYCYDLETNAYKESESKFRALVQRKDKQTGETRWVTPDERDLRELINKHGAICERNAILQSLPPDFVDDAMESSSKTLRDAAAKQLKDNPAQTAKDMVVAFEPLGVTAEMLTAYLGHALDIMTAEEVAKFKGIYASIRDGQSRREEHFQMAPAPASETGGSKSDELAAKLGGKKTPKSKAGEPPADFMGGKPIEIAAEKNT